MLMKALYVLLALSLAAIVGAVAAMLWRLRWHLQRPHLPPPDPALNSMVDAPQEQEPVEKA
jgi:hypothetical protein